MKSLGSSQPMAVKRRGGPMQRLAERAFQAEESEQPKSHQRATVHIGSGSAAIALVMKMSSSLLRCGSTPLRLAMRAAANGRLEPDQGEDDA